MRQSVTMTTGFIALVAAMTAGCSKGYDVDTTKAAAAVLPTYTATATKVDPVFKASVEQALLDVPVAMRADFQKAFSCELKQIYDDADKKKTPPIRVDAATIRQLTGRLKADRSLANC